MQSKDLRLPRLLVLGKNERTKEKAVNDWEADDDELAEEGV